MITSDFLRLLLPTDGWVMICHPIGKHGAFRNEPFATLEEAIGYIDSVRDSKDVFYAMARFTHNKVWNPNKKNHQTGELGAYEYRTKANAQEIRSFFMDIDIGEPKESDTHLKFATRSEARAGLKQFLEQTGLPIPLMVSSGGGLHLYWPMEDPMTIKDWEVQARRLKALCQKLGFRIDPAVTADAARILRVPGTYNYKKAERREVQILNEVAAIPNEDFIKVLTKACEAANLSAREINPVVLDEFEVKPQYIPLDYEVMTRECGIMKYVDDHADKIGYNAWFFTMRYQLMCRDGEAIAHRIHSRHPGYDKDENDNKIAESLRSDMRKSCANLAIDVGREDICKACRHYNSKVVRNPADACSVSMDISVDAPTAPLPVARPPKPAPAPVVSQDEDYLDEDDIMYLSGAEEVPDATVPKEEEEAPESNALPALGPLPGEGRTYQRTADGRILVKVKKKKGVTGQLEDVANGGTDDDFEWVVLFERPFYPVRLSLDRHEDGQSSIWHYHTYHDGVLEMSVLSSELGDQRLMTSKLFKHTIHSTGTDDATRKIKYMSAYISSLQKTMAAQEQFNYLGWNDARDQFVLAGTTILSDGSTKPTSLSRAASVIGQHVAQVGDRKYVDELLKIYNSKSQYIPHQIYITASLAAPFMYLTGQHGMVINATGFTGSGKSSMMQVAAAFWAKPDKYIMNGTRGSMTANALRGRLAMCVNMPVFIDEITHYTLDEASTLTMNSSQANGEKIRQKMDGTEKDKGLPEKANITLTTSNSSLHGVLAESNQAGTAGSMRVYEMDFPKLADESDKYEVRRLMMELRDNHGHIGLQFMRYAITRLDVLRAEVKAEIEIIDKEFGLHNSERLWCAYCALQQVIARHAYLQGFLPFNPAPQREWMRTVQLPMMRGVVSNEYVSAVAMIASFIAENIRNMAVFDSDVNGQKLHRSPDGSLLIRYERDTKELSILRSAFKTYCDRNGSSMSKILNEAHACIALGSNGRRMELVTDKNRKVILGKGSAYAVGQQRCIVVNMAHPEIALPEDTWQVISNSPSAKPIVVQTPKPELKVVQPKQESTGNWALDKVLEEGI